MFTHEIYTKNDNGNWELESHISAFELANDVCRYDDGCDEMTPQEVLELLGRATTCFFYEGEDMIKAVRLDAPLYENRYGELRTASEMQDEENDWAEMDSLYEGLQVERWEEAECNSRVNW